MLQHGDLKVQTIGKGLLDHPVCITCKAVYVCMLLNSCVHTLHSIPSIWVFFLLAVSSSDLCAEDGLLESQSQVNPVNGFIGLGHPKLCLLNSSKGLGYIGDTPLPSKG